MTNERWVAETRHGQTVGWCVYDVRTGALLRVIRYVDAPR